MARPRRARIRLMVLAGIMSGLASALQISAAVFPGPGHVASALATFPLAVAAWMNPGAGIAACLVAAFAVLMAAPGECPIILTTTGPLGVALGIAGAAGLSWAAQTLAGAATLCCGMVGLAALFKTDPLGPGPASIGRMATTGLYAAFALAYSWIWTGITRRLVPRLLVAGEAQPDKAHDKTGG